MSTTTRCKIQRMDRKHDPSLHLLWIACGRAKCYIRENDLKPTYGGAETRSSNCCCMSHLTQRSPENCVCSALCCGSCLCRSRLCSCSRFACSSCIRSYLLWWIFESCCCSRPFRDAACCAANSASLFSFSFCFFSSH